MGEGGCSDGACGSWRIEVDSEGVKQLYIFWVYRYGHVLIADVQKYMKNLGMVSRVNMILNRVYCTKKAIAFDMKVLYTKTITKVHVQALCLIS